MLFVLRSLVVPPQEHRSRRYSGNVDAELPIKQPKIPRLRHDLETVVTRGRGVFPIKTSDEWVQEIMREQKWSEEQIESSTKRKRQFPGYLEYIHSPSEVNMHRVLPFITSSRDPVRVVSAPPRS